jgi:hypothetical protein
MNARSSNGFAGISQDGGVGKAAVAAPNGNIRYQLKTPYRESLPHERSECFGCGTTHVIFEPLDFIARLAPLAPKTLVLLAGRALPKPRVNLTRFVCALTHALGPRSRTYRATWCICARPA